MINRLSKESYLHLVAFVATLCGVVQGFLTIQSELGFVDTQFLLMIHGFDVTFFSQYKSVLYGGELLGSLCSFAFSDFLGRSSTISYSSLMCATILIWNAVTLSSSNLLFARFFAGFFLGMAMTTAPIYIAEVIIQYSLFNCVK